jgi:hypothetical protein
MIRAAEPLEARGFVPTQTSNPSGESAFPRPLRKVISAGTRERFAFAVSAATWVLGVSASL